MKTIAVPLGQKPRNLRLVFSLNIQQATCPIQNAHVLCRSLWFFQDLPLSETPPRGWKTAYVNRKRFGIESHLIAGSNRIDRLLRVDHRALRPNRAHTVVDTILNQQIARPIHGDAEHHGQKETGPMLLRGEATADGTPASVSDEEPAYDSAGRDSPVE